MSVRLRVPRLPSPAAGFRRRWAMRRCADDGFSLIEVMVAFILFMIVSASATVAIANATKTSSTTGSKIAATNLAQQYLQQARALPVASLTAGLNIPAMPTQVGNGTYTVSQSACLATAASTAAGQPTCAAGAPSACPTPAARVSGTQYMLNVSVNVTMPDGKRTVVENTVLSC